MIGLCTDSGAQLPAELLERFGVEVVPLTVTVDDIDHLEGHDLDPDAFYHRLALGQRPEVRTVEPSAGQFAAAYEELMARGCTGILSVHGCAHVSRTVHSARLAARSVNVPVRVVDSGSAGFGVGCCVWEAAEAIAAGANLDEAARVAEALTAEIGNLFIVQPAGRPAAAGLDMLSWERGRLDVVDHAGDHSDALHRMAERATAWGRRIRVAVGHTCSGSASVADELAATLAAASNVAEVAKRRGNTISTISPDAKAKWIKACEPIAGAWAAQVKGRGLDGEKLIAAAKALVAKHEKA